MTFGEKLQQLRKQHHLSQEKLAEQLNVSRQAISKWEMGAMPDLDNVIRISRIFDCSLDYLLKDEIREDKREKFRKPSWKPETLCLLPVIPLLLVMIVLYLVSKFTDVDLHVQDAATGAWYGGFSKFVLYYDLRGLVFVLAFLLVLCLSLRVYIQLLVRKRKENRKYLIYRTASWGLYLWGIVQWANAGLCPNIFIWDALGFLTVGVYIVLTVWCALRVYCFERGESGIIVF